MTVFVDTSAFYAVLDRDDLNHDRAKEAWKRLLGEAVLVTHNYVLVETCALVQHRLGMAALRAFHEDMLPTLETKWVSEHQHRAGLEAVLAASRKKLSLVDCVSFQVMREHGIRTTFCFDAHFHEQGFDIRPSDDLSTNLSTK